MHLVYSNHCFQFLLDITVVPREIEGTGYAAWGKQCALWSMQKWWIYQTTAVNFMISNTLTVTSETSHILRLLISLCAFHDVFLSLIPVLIFTVRGISRTFNKKCNINLKIRLITAAQSAKTWSDYAFRINDSNNNNFIITWIRRGDIEQVRTRYIMVVPNMVSAGPKVKN